MITAAEARNKVDKLKEEKINSELKRIEELICKAIEKREENVWVYGGMMPETIVSLKNRGYNVSKEQTGPYEITSKVSW